MKKTIVAAAVAAVFAAPAMADVSISGQINAEISSIGNGNGSAVNTDITFSGSEDLGNGMKASFNITRTSDTDQTAADYDSRGANMFVGLSGDFGSLTLGKFEPYSISNISSIQNIDASEQGDIEDTNDMASATDGGIRYVSPSFNGLTVGVEGFRDGSQAYGDTFDTSTFFAQYSANGLTVRAASETQSVASGDITVTSLGAIYKMGDFEIRAMTSTDDNASSADVDSTFYGVSYTMGANQIAFGTLNSDDTTVDGDSIISLKHSLSKNTSAYIVVDSNDDGVGQTVVGMKHAF
jgi:predicted porin